MKLKIGMLVMMFGVGNIVYTFPLQDFIMLGLSLPALLGGYYLFQLETKTPAKAFLAAQKKKFPIMEMERKDQNIEYIVPRDVSAGCALSDKYGLYQIDESGIKTEHNSRVKIMHCLEGIGINISGKHIRVIKGMQMLYGAKNYHDIINLSKMWNQCTNKECPGHQRDKHGNITGWFEGPFEEEKKKVIDKETGELVETKTGLKCPKCGKMEGKALDPPLAVPTMQNIEPGYVDNFFKHNQNPILTQANVEDAVMNKFEKEKKDIMKTFITLTGVAMVVICFFIGLYILLQGGFFDAAKETVSSGGQTVKGVLPWLIPAILIFPKKLNGTPTKSS